MGKFIFNIMKKLLTLLISILFTAVLSAQYSNTYTYPFYIGKTGTSTGSITLYGVTSGSALLRVSATAGTGTIFQLPATNGSTGQVLTTNGSGILAWGTNGIVVADTATMLAKYLRALNSVLTGVPTAPTAAALTNTTQIATTAFATTADNLKVNISDSEIGRASCREKSVQ